MNSNLQRSPFPQPPLVPTSASQSSPSTSTFENLAAAGFGSELRQGRPSNPRRQSSYSKRHASFDTPREIPFSVEQPSEGFFRRDSISRSSSESTVSATGRSLTPLRSQAAQDHAISPTAVSRTEDRYRGASSMAETSSTTQFMTCKTGDALDGGSVSSASSSRDRRNDSAWDSERLRPQLLSTLRKGKDRDLQSQSPVAPSSPYLLHASDGIHCPRPTRPSSTLSLPLPSQMPLSAFASSSLEEVSGGLPSVVEQAVSDFGTSANFSKSDAPMDTTPMSPSGDFSPMFDPQTLRRRASSPSSSPGNLLALFAAADRHGRRFGRESAAGSISTVSTSISTSSTGSTASSSLPPPTPPTVLSPSPPPSTTEITDERRSIAEGEKRRSAPYEPFLSHAPPSADTFIAVETLDKEYRLIVKLPGYDRDCIMLSTRRRRILHIAADSWKAGGGHFERRISFGYDADLSHVRAEFDGEHLRVLVPRKVVPVFWSGGDSK